MTMMNFFMKSMLKSKLKGAGVPEAEIDKLRRDAITVDATPSAVLAALKGKVG